MMTALDRVSRRVGPHDDRRGAMGSVRPSRRTKSGFGAVRRVERSMALRVAVIGVHGQCGEPVARTAPSRHASDIDRRESPDVGQRGIGGPPRASGSTGSTTRRLFHELGRVPPAEFEHRYYRQHLSPRGRDPRHRACVKPGEVQWAVGGRSGAGAVVGVASWVEWRRLVRAQAERTRRSALR
jgi:hypothetical protein